MARGNDAAAASSEFEGQYGIHPNAEALVNAHRAASDPALERASLTQIDGEETDKLDLSKIKPSRGGTVLAAAVRGNALVYVAEDESGRTYKDVEPYNDSYRAPAEDPAAAGARAAAQGDVELSRKAAEIQAKIEKDVAEARAEIEQKHGKEMAEFMEGQAKESQEAQEQAEEDAEQAQKDATDPEKSKGEQAPKSEPKQGGGPKQARGNK